MRFSRIFCFVFLFFCFLNQTFPQNLGYELNRHKLILSTIKDEVKKNYYDSNFHGIDIEQNFRTSVEKLQKATSIGQMSGIVAQFLLDFDDSHLNYFPPTKVNKTDYGFNMRLIGDKCFVYRVSENSHAEKTGLRPGDEIKLLDGFIPTREIFWKMRYFYYRLRPQPYLKLSVKKPDGNQFEYQINAKIIEGTQIQDLTNVETITNIQENNNDLAKTLSPVFYEKIPGLFIWKMPTFNISPSEIDDICNKARKSKTIILDLRGNAGGSANTLLRLVGNFFSKTVRIGVEKRRNETKEIEAKSSGNNSFQGNLIVLIDSDSASASEVFSRVIQLEKRGLIIGDRSAGAVMKSKYLRFRTGLDVVAFYGLNLTIADLTMTDGKNLEKNGVIPDETILPTPNDLANNKDIVLARAIELAGYSVSIEDASKILIHSPN